MISLVHLINGCAATQYRVMHGHLFFMCAMEGIYAPANQCVMQTTSLVPRPFPPPLSKGLGTRLANYCNDHCFIMDSFLRNMSTARLNVHVFPGRYDYRSVGVNGTEYIDVAVPLIYMAAGLQT